VSPAAFPHGVLRKEVWHRRMFLARITTRAASRVARCEFAHRNYCIAISVLARMHSKAADARGIPASAWCIRRNAGCGRHAPALLDRAMCRGQPLTKCLRAAHYDGCRARQPTIRVLEEPDDE